MSADRRKKEMAARAEQGDLSVLTIPTQRISCIDNFDVENHILAATRQAFLFVPDGALWPSSAQGFGQTRGSIVANSVEAFERMVHLFFYCANALGDGKEDGKKIVYPKWIPVPTADDPKKNAGYLIVLTFQVNPDTVSSLIESLIERNNRTRKAILDLGYEPKSNGPKSPYTQIDSSAYHTLCSWNTLSIDARDPSVAAEAFQNLSSADNPYNFFNVFSKKVACAKMKNVGAAREYCRLASYGNCPAEDPSDVKLAMPAGARVHLMTAAHMDPMQLHTRKFPHVVREFDSECPELKSFFYQSGVKLAADGDDDDAQMNIDYDSEAEDAGVPSAVRTQEVYCQLAPSCDVESGCTLESFKARVKKRMTQVDAQFDKVRQPRQYFAARREAQKELIDYFFEAIFTEDATSDCGDAMKAAAKYYREFLSTHKNFLMPVAKFSKNLSRYADFQAADAAATESTWNINTSHQEAKSLRLSVMHVYYYSPFHAHAALLGPPACGKSKVCELTYNNMIEGTAKDVGSESAKAKNTPGKRSDLMVEFQEDIQPSAIGISGSGPGKPSGGESATANTNDEAMLKYRLTKGKIKCSYKQVINGVHATLEIESFCNTVLVIGSNAAVSDIPSSISNRFNCMQFQHKERLNSQGQAQGMFNKYAAAKDRNLDPARDQMKVRLRRNQLFHLFLQLLCWSGVFAAPLMTIPELVVAQTLADAKDAGLHETGSIRNYERVLFHIETTLMEDVIDRMLDSSRGFKPNTKWHPHQLIEFEKHLWANTEHTAFALGLLQHQYENPIIANIENHLKNVTLKDKIRNRQVGKPNVAPEQGRDMDYYYVFSLSDGYNSSMQFNNVSDRAQHTAGMIRLLAAKLLPAMKQKPAEGEVVHALQCLNRLEIRVQDKDNPNNTIDIQALRFGRDNEVMVAADLMHKVTKDRLRACLLDVLSHKYTRPKNILYGRTDPSLPFVWSTMIVLPKPTRKLVMEQPTYCAEATRSLTQGWIEGVVINNAEDQTQSVKEKLTSHLDTLYSSVSHRDVDVDLDDCISNHQAQRIGLAYFPPTPDAPGGETSSKAFNDAVMRDVIDAGMADDLKHYPTCFSNELSTLASREAMIADKKANPTKYSLAATMSRKRPRDAEEHQEERKEHDEDDGNAPLHRVLTVDEVAAMADEMRDDSWLHGDADEDIDGFSVVDPPDPQHQDKRPRFDDSDDQAMAAAVDEFDAVLQAHGAAATSATISFSLR